jgi:hypothetical protein
VWEEPVPRSEDPAAWEADIVFELYGNESEFPQIVEFNRFPGEHPSAVPIGIELARLFAERFSCRTLSDGTGFGDDDSPYWLVVWDKGVPHLADDCGTLFADGEGGPVKVLRPIEVPRLRLGSNGLPLP